MLSAMGQANIANPTDDVLVLLVERDRHAARIGHKSSAILRYEDGQVTRADSASWAASMKWSAHEGLPQSRLVHLLQV